MSRAAAVMPASPNMARRSLFTTAGSLHAEALTTHCALLLALLQRRCAVKVELGFKRTRMLLTCVNVITISAVTEQSR